ncbi:glycoside hydrolase domain-containing protein [Streptomyces sp. NPDC005318]|uniref:glycoside hydrolase domain-containing protein n=1 Tax=Streptomyces sp. NPDC005318 TaxID=3157031 RepID=UPI0033BC2481
MALQRPGQPWKTQATVRQILDTVYGTGHGGLPGNDDLGTRSAWYVFSAPGLHPQTPGSATMLLGAPLRADRPCTRQGHHDRRPGRRRRAAVHRRDRLWTDPSLVARGSTLALRLAEAPDSSWGTATSGPPR